MRDWWHDLLELADHNRGTLLASVIVAALAAYLFGCDATTASLIEPSRLVSSRQLRAEIRQLESGLAQQRNALAGDVANFNDQVSRFNEAAETATSDIKRQHEMRRQLVQLVGGFASDAAEGSFNPVGAISTLVTLITAGTAAGLAVDNYRKGSVIRLLKDGSDGKQA